MDLKAKMPSKVEELKVKVGDTVTKGQQVAILEAMKMKTPIVSPAAGTVKSIAISVGDRIKPGSVIMVIE